MVLTRPARSAWAVRGLFGLTGILFGSWASRVPALAARTDADEADLALVFVGLNLGAVLGLLLGRWLTTRLGSRTALGWGMPAVALSLTAILLATDPPSLAVTLFVFGTAVSVCDVGLNAQGLRTEDLVGRHLLSGMHASFSLGMGVGSLLGAAFEAGGISLAAGFLATTAAALPAGVWAVRHLLPDPAAPTGVRPTGRGWSPRLVLIGMLAFSAALAEGAANDWAAVYLHDVTGAEPSTAALGFAAFSLAMFLGRLLGDPLTEQWGRVTVFRAGTALAAASLTVALLWQETAPALAALALCGLGVSCTLPVALSAGGRVPGLDQTRAIANAATLGYLGFFTGPALIGWIAAGHGLAVGLALPAVLLAAASAGAGALRIPT